MSLANFTSSRSHVSHWLKAQAGALLAALADACLRKERESGKVQLKSGEQFVRLVETTFCFLLATHHSMIAAPHVSPAPNAISNTRSPH